MDGVLGVKSGHQIDSTLRVVPMPYAMASIDPVGEVEWVSGLRISLAEAAIRSGEILSSDLWNDQGVDSKQDIAWRDASRQPQFRGFSS